MHTDAIRAILERDVQQTGWDIAPPRDGRLRNDAFVATNGQHTLFVKFDVVVPVVQRLATLHIVPRIVGAGRYKGRSYMVQDYVDGPSPPRPWFTAHLPAVAAFMKRYQTDTPLRRLLRPAVVPSYHAQVQHELHHLADGLQRAHSAALRTAATAAALRHLRQQARALPALPLVPTHGDPNSTNFLRGHDQFYLIDWDEVALSDPLRDTGLLLWWYVPRAHWPDFFAAYGLCLDAVLLQRLYWWSAHASLRIALWVDAHTHDTARVEAFLTDFHAALHGHGNPHGPDTISDCTS